MCFENSISKEALKTLRKAQNMAGRSDQADPALAKPLFKLMRFINTTLNLQLAIAIATIH